VLSRGKRLRRIDRIRFQNHQWFRVRSNDSFTPYPYGIKNLTNVSFVNYCLYRAKSKLLFYKSVRRYHIRIYKKIITGGRHRTPNSWRWLEVSINETEEKRFSIFFFCFCYQCTCHSNVNREFTTSSNSQSERKRMRFFFHVNSVRFSELRGPNTTDTYVNGSGVYALSIARDDDRARVCSDEFSSSTPGIHDTVVWRVRARSPTDGRTTPPPPPPVSLLFFVRACTTRVFSSTFSKTFLVDIGCVR